MENDDRCCGTGTCIMDAAGRCWCGQQWDGEKMYQPTLDTAPATRAEPPAPLATANATFTAQEP